MRNTGKRGRKVIETPDSASQSSAMQKTRKRQKPKIIYRQVYRELINVSQRRSFEGTKRTDYSLSDQIAAAPENRDRQDVHTKRNSKPPNRS
ncbi:hypothetical protein BDV33DRAFT_55995 [Aspergillus novoparasiticus]|uniref:Uncharacterized protein n=1 Tax=Aspergillus novoparasiticus TaxID=986946 RepID=A0A5N6EYY2_9EURO|nr:hypothetical protein BDV33DRAFT_55995 [Aspergillus novoparasiticus]